ncbi:MAG: peptide chain release factor 2 [Actinomycetota bacterium]|nr:peptide chain release factor 2 [Actinomycetota bacterium]
MVESAADAPARLKDLRSRLDDARRFLDVAGKASQLDELRRRASSPDLWDDPDHAKQLTRQLARFEQVVDQSRRLEQALEDAQVLLELADEEGDVGARAEVGRELDRLEGELSTLERESLFFGEYDDHAAIASVHAGAGGVDAQDWAEMLLRMYLRYLEDGGYRLEVDEVLPGEEAGIKSATFTVRGPFAYGVLEGERGVHRLVRISPFDAASRRHTSFAGVDVIPEVEEAEVEVDPDDLRIETFRSQGAGGQHVNVTDSAVRITHLPTGVVVACQAERSQLQNRARAMTLLRARLAELARQQHRRQLDEIRGEQDEAAWGRQIRSYVLQPYQMAKDLRTGLEVGNVQGVLDGGLEPLVESYLHWRRANREAGE